MEHGRHLGFHVYVSDFANILKAFVGSNFLSIPFGLGQCGLLLGVVGLAIIGALTTHCCHLLVKCKYHAIQHIVGLLRHPYRLRRTHYRRKSVTSHWKLFTDHLIHPDEMKEEKDNSADAEYSLDVQQRLTKSLNYGDLARMCLGQWGLALTNIAIIITQTGFCVNYAIFAANAMMSFFPFYTCTVQLQLNVSSASHDCQYLVGSPWKPWAEDLLNMSKTTGNIVDHKNIDALPDQLITTPGDGLDTVNNNATSTMVNRSNTGWLLAASPAGSVVKLNSSSALSSAIVSNASLSLTGQLSPTSLLPQPSSTPSSSPVALSEVLRPSSTGAPKSMDSVTIDANRPAFTLVDSSVTGDGDLPSSSVAASSSQFVWSETWRDGPDLRLLFLFPLMIFVLLILPRKMRGLGIISSVGNLALLVGSLTVLVAVIMQFHVSDSWMWVRLEGLPLFFGTTASAFEGAGTMMPVEASMEGNRHNFVHYLAWGIGGMVVMHTCLCVLSYLSFGSDIAQLVTMNIQGGSGLSVAVNVCLTIGILFTFPIMAFPVVHLAEEAVLGKGSNCGRQKDDTEQLLSGGQRKPSTPAFDILLTVSPWKRNLLRISVVLVIVVTAMVLRNSFAYVAAFIGALGSTFVAFILPCVFHLCLCWPCLPMSIKIKDLTIITVGVVFCITGVFSVVRDMIA